MGRFMIPCCCICGKSPMQWHEPTWEAGGGLQDFCPDHATDALEEFVAPHLEVAPNEKLTRPKGQRADERRRG